MSDFKVVSRKDLYTDGLDGIQKVHSEEEVNEVLIKPDFEIVEYEPTNIEPNENDNGSTEQAEDEFDFPLFSFGTAAETTTSAQSSQDVNTDTTNRGRSEVKLMKISLREPSPEVLIQERPKSYYFADYNEEDKVNFSKSSIEFDDIFRNKNVIIKKPGNKHKAIDLKEFNNKIDEINRRENIIKKRRPCKKQRIARKLAAEKVKEREVQLKKLKKEMKKHFHKRGGKKNKKKEAFNPLKNAGATPRFRTE